MFMFSITLNTKVADYLGTKIYEYWIIDNGILNHREIYGSES